MTPQYKRIVLKISGEILGSRSEGEPIHAKSLENICEEIKAVSDKGVELAWLSEEEIFSEACKVATRELTVRPGTDGYACNGDQRACSHGPA